MSIKVSHRHKAPKSAYREVGFMIFLTLVPWPIIAFVFPQFGFNTTNMIITMLIFGALTFLLWFVGYRRRSSSELFGIIDYDYNSITVWMRRPSSAWKENLSINNIFHFEDEIESASVDKINNNRVLALRLKGQSNKFHLPQRLAVNEEVKKFFENYLNSESGKNSVYKNLIEKFINGDTGIVVREEKHKDTPKTISELIEEEKAQEAKKDFNEILAEEARLRNNPRTNRQI